MASSAIWIPASTITHKHSTGVGRLKCKQHQEEEEGIEDRRRELKEALEERIEETNANLDDKAMEMISSLELINPTHDLMSVSQLYKGCFMGLRASFKNSGKKGEAQKQVGYAGALVTLGRASFNAFKPHGLSIRLNQTYNHVGQASDDEYSLGILLDICDYDIQGMLINRAKFTISGPKRMDVVFESTKLCPLHPEKDLTIWKKVFQTQNEDFEMNKDDGSLTANLPAAKGWLQYLYLDEEIRITKGNRGGISVVKRIPAPLFSI